MKSSVLWRLVSFPSSLCHYKGLTVEVAVAMGAVCRLSNVDCPPPEASLSVVPAARPNASSTQANTKPQQSAILWENQ